MRKDKVFLASSSPRRQALLKDIVDEFQVLKLGIVEPEWDQFETPKAYVLRTLRAKIDGALKAASALPKDPDPRFVIVADTTVALGLEVLGKPRHNQDAFIMLSKLSGKQHEVMTAVAVIRVSHDQNPLVVTKLVRSQVLFRRLSPREIREYIQSGQPMDKAGAYGFQDQALQFVQSLGGSYLNVIGLPVQALRKLLVAAGMRGAS